MVVAEAMLGTKGGDFELSDSDGVGVVACVEVLRDGGAEASIVSESLSLGTESVEELDEDGRDWWVETLVVRTGLRAESGE